MPANSMHSVTQDTDSQGNPLPLTGILPGVNEVKDGTNKNPCNALMLSPKFL